MDEGDNAVSVTDTSVEQTTQAESAPAEQTAQEPIEAPEKAETTEEGQPEDGSLEESKTVPYDRLKKEIERRKALEQQYQESRIKAEQFDKLAEVTRPQEQQDPTLKRADEQLQSLEYLKKEQAREIAREEIRAELTAERFNRQSDELAKKYNGQDGSPKFIPEDVTDFLDQKGYSPSDFMTGKINLEDAYLLMHREGIIDAKAKQKRGTPSSEKPGKPMASQETTSQADFDEAKKSGNWENILKKRMINPFK